MRSVIHILEDSVSLSSDSEISHGRPFGSAPYPIAHPSRSQQNQAVAYCFGRQFPSKWHQINLKLDRILELEYYLNCTENPAEIGVETSSLYK